MTGFREDGLLPTTLRSNRRKRQTTEPDAQDWPGPSAESRLSGSLGLGVAPQAGLTMTPADRQIDRTMELPNWPR